MWPPIGRTTTRRRSVVWLSCGLTVVAVLAYVFSQWREQTRDRSAGELLDSARAALKRGDYAAAEEQAARIDRPQLAAQARIVAGEAATRADRLPQAIAYYQSVPRDGSKPAIVAAFSLGEVYRASFQLDAAEQQYRYVIEKQPFHLPAQARLAFLLTVTGRRRESVPHFLAMLRRREISVEEMIMLGDLERAVDQEEFLNQCTVAAPDDVLADLGIAALSLARGELLRAESLLRRVVDRKPELLTAQAMLGELCVPGSDETFLMWHEQLPPAADNDPEIWLVRGLWARRHRELKVAARCFWECVLRAPAQRRANYQLGQVLSLLGEPAATEFAERAIQLFDLARAFDEAFKSEAENPVALKRIVDILTDCGRHWEACAWADIASQRFPLARWPQESLERLRPPLTDATPQVLESGNLALRRDFSTFPDHRDLVKRSSRTEAPQTARGAGATIRFEDTPHAGIDFVYVNGSDPLIDEEPAPAEGETAKTTDVRTRIRIRNRTRIFEQNGGGIAVLDFDGDGRPDLYFTQGCEWKHGSSGPTLSSKTTDRLYRNLGTGEFADVTGQAQLVDHGYGQGPAAGDFDNDGFPDLYVANIGRNQLHHNNGDGTFADVTDQCGLTSSDWTASCVIVDLNADGLPDLFDVTYLTGEHVYDAVCNGHACSPKVFEGLPDRLLINRGDGTFEIHPQAFPDTSSKGLGIVALDLDQRGRPSLFIANDQVPNYLMRNYQAADRFNVRLQEEGFACGLAFNESGLALASMGVAADDANGDGLVDFFVTTFREEPRVLYRQDPPGSFFDATGASGLRATGWSYVGWGTQFLDADCDGAPDLVAANGHVDDYRPEGGEYHMRPQFFRNAGGGRFVEFLADQAGPYFAGKYLGRGLARLDWNRDGRTDFAVSNIGSRASLVTNHTQGGGHFINIRLHARATARDAIGSVVEVVAGKRHWSKQLMAGDGYMASNERLLQFGLGENATVAELRVTWPSGATTRLADLPADVTMELIEGSSRGVQWRGTEPEALIVPSTTPPTP